MVGAILHDQRDYTVAEPLLREAVTACANRLQSDHPRVASSANELAWLHLDTGDYAAAEPLFVEAEMIYRHRLGEQHPDQVSPMLGLAQVKLARGQAAAAEKEMRTARAICQAAFADGHWLTASVENVLGASLIARDRCDEGLPLLVESHAAMEAIRSPHDRYVLDACRRASEGLERCGNREQAAEYRARLQPADGPDKREEGTAP